MGESVPAAEISEIRTILTQYLEYKDAAIVSAKQVDPDATIFKLIVDGRTLFLLEEDYISDIKWVVTRFSEYGLRKPVLCKLIVPDEVTKDDNSFDELGLYEAVFKPSKLKYAVLYYLAKENRA